MVSVGVSKLYYAGLILFDLGVKINEICYCDFFLSQELLPAVSQVSGELSKQCPSVHCTGHVSFQTLIFHKVV